MLVGRVLTVARWGCGLDRAIVNRSVIGQGADGDVGHYLTAPSSTPAWLINDLADDGSVEIPFLKYCLKFCLASAGGDNQHPLLRFGQEHLVGGQVLLTQGNLVEVQIDSECAACRHLARR